MSAFGRIDCLCALGAVLLAGLFAAPLLATDPAQTKKPAHKDPRPAQARSTGIRGCVTDENAKPLPDVRLWLGWREDDHGQKPLVVKTDAQGKYRLDMPDVRQPTRVVLDATKPGFARHSASWTGPGPFMSCQVTPGKWAERDLKLRPALYVAGVVVDERGKPISGVQVTADEVGAANTSESIDSNESNSDGSFELFNYPLQPPTAGKDAPKGLVSFSHASYMDSAIPDVYALAPRERDRLRVVLKSGRKISGTVLDVAGKPLPDAVVKATAPDGTRRRMTGSDADGNFVLGGLSDGPTLLTVLVPKIEQKARIPLDLREDHHDLKVRLQSISLPRDLKTYSVLGMVLADVTPELRAAYELDGQTGVLVLHPLKGPEVLEGSLVRSIDDQPVSNIRDFAAKILASAAKDKTDQHSMYIDYVIHDFDGMAAAELKPTRADLEDLRDLLRARLAADQEAILALSRLGAQFRLKQPDDHSEAGPEVSAIVLGNKWKGGDSDLRLVSTLAVRNFLVRGWGKVSDKALEELRTVRPDIGVARVSEAFLGAEFVGEQEKQPRVANVLPNSPAARADFKKDDIILQFAGKPTPDFYAFRAVTFTLRPGQKVPAMLLRNGKTLDVTVEMGSWD